MMNNLHYMVKTVEGSEALTVLGEEWIEQHKDQVCLPCSLGLRSFPQKNKPSNCKLRQGEEVCKQHQRLACGAAAAPRPSLPAPVMRT